MILVEFFIVATTNEYKSYRHGIENMEANGLTFVYYSTTVTLGQNRLKWAKFKGEKSGIKLYMAINTSNCTPQKIICKIHEVKECFNLLEQEGKLEIN